MKTTYYVKKTNVKYVVGLRDSTTQFDFLDFVNEKKGVETNRNESVHGKGQQCLRFFQADQSINQISFSDYILTFVFHDIFATAGRK